MQGPGEEQGEKQALIVYALYLFSFIVGISPLIGVVIAYLYRRGAPDWLRTHYQFQIRTFWLVLLAVVIGAMLAAAFIGWLIILAAAAWLILRCVVGIKRLGERRPIDNPASLLLGG